MATTKPASSSATSAPMSFGLVPREIVFIAAAILGLGCALTAGTLIADGIGASTAPIYFASYVGPAVAIAVLLRFIGRRL
jgi:hypothetical protein